MRLLTNLQNEIDEKDPEEEEGGRLPVFAELRDSYPEHAVEVQGLIDKLYGEENTYSSVLFEFNSVAEAVYELKPMDDMTQDEMLGRLNDDLAAWGLPSFETLF